MSLKTLIIFLGKIKKGVCTKLYEAIDVPYLNRGKIPGANIPGNLGGLPEVYKGGEKS